jgi:hypothetical protein
VKESGEIQNEPLAGWTILVKSNAAKKNWNPYLSRSAVRQDLDYGGERRRHEALGGSYPHAITSIGRMIERQATHPRRKSGIAARPYQCRRRHAGSQRLGVLRPAVARHHYGPFIGHRKLEPNGDVS